ncbi:peptidylprolyl isomerase family protein [Granulicella cerasi]|uniref:peptidylprolyl isomerase n=1 Tax=Granulicella cerasi TaxID=741063 RepID=UPI0021E0B875|nr:peptidylprolyl isomerase [Granulicella cerasi]
MMKRLFQLDRITVAALLPLALCVGFHSFAANAQGDRTQDKPTVKQDAAPEMPTSPGETIDRVVAIVNNDLVLDSDVDEERRFSAFLTVREPDNATRERIIQRLINRELILQQAKLQADIDISDDDVKKSLDEVRKSLPACKQYACETQAGWDRFLAKNGFNEADFTTLWKERMQVLAFVEERFKQGIRISDTDIANYYNNTFAPQYRKTGGTPPKLAAVHDRIAEVLLEQQVSALLGDWLKSLRAQGQVVVVHPGEAAP